MSARKTTVASPPLPTRAELAEYAARDLEIKAAGRRAFFRAVSIACPDHHVGVGVSCWVIPSDAPGAGLDVPVVCPRRAAYASTLASS